MKRPYIPLGCTQQERVTPTKLLDYEDDTGLCNTCPGELEPAECLQREPGPEPYPWRLLGAGLLVMFMAVGGASVIAALMPASAVVAAR